MITRASKLLVIAAATACGAALAQATPELVAIDPEQRLLGQLDELRAEQGTNAEGLVEPLRALALLYQEAGDHVSAVVALQEARQVVRANRGLFSATVDEALLLRQQIRSEKALGNGERAWNLQHDLVTIARQNLDDIRMLPVFLELIDDRTEVLDEYSTTSFRDLRPGIYVPCAPDAVLRVNGGMRTPPAPVSDARNCAFGTWRTVVERLQWAVLRHHADAIAVIIRSGDYASEELRRLEKQALSLVPFERGYIACSIGTLSEFLESELVDSCMDTVRGAGVGGWASLMRLIFYEVRSGAPPAARARAFAELGDWYLRAEHLNSRSKFDPADELALRLYERAVTELREGDDTAEAVAGIFSPELPVMLPTHVPNPLASTESSRFIDIAFAITNYGQAEQIEILDSSRNATRAEERRLTRLIEFGSFRPRALNGELADSAPVVVRYYLAENSLSAQ